MKVVNVKKKEIIEYEEDDLEELEDDDGADDIEIDPDWVKTPRVSRVSRRSRQKSLEENYTVSLS